MPSTNTLARAGAANAVPFVRAARPYLAGPFFDEIVTPDTAQQFFSTPIPAHGYLKGIFILVEGVNGVLQPGDSLDPDFPWNALQAVALVNTNGTPMVGPFDTGFHAYLGHRYGAYFWKTDPATWDTFDGTINPVAIFYLPVQIREWDGLGSLANMNQQQQWRVNFAVAAASQLVSGGNGSTLPDLHIRCYQSEWTLPAATTPTGIPQEVTPPAHGTFQFWSEQTFPVVSGFNTFYLQRMGNVIRNLVLEFRDSNGVRDQSAIPDDLTVQIDVAQYLVRVPNALRSGLESAKEGGLTPDGVIVFDYTADADGHLGFEDGDAWLPTVEGTKYQIQGTFGASGKLFVITNDIIPAGIVPIPVAP